MANHDPVAVYLKGCVGRVALVRAVKDLQRRVVVLEELVRNGRGGESEPAVAR